MVLWTDVLTNKKEHKTNQKQNYHKWMRQQSTDKLTSPGNQTQSFIVVSTDISSSVSKRHNKSDYRNPPDNQTQSFIVVSTDISSSVAKCHYKSDHRNPPRKASTTMLCSKAAPKPIAPQLITKNPPLRINHIKTTHQIAHTKSAQ